MATVTFDHMVKRYPGDVLAVNDLNLAIRAEDKPGRWACRSATAGS